jgi:hypothetical protein
VSNEIIPKQTALQMEKEYREAIELVRNGYAILGQAQKKLNDTFGRYTAYGDLGVYANPALHFGSTDFVNALEDKLLRSAWARVLGILELGKLMTEKAYKDYQKRLEKDKLPDLTLVNIFELFSAFSQNQPEYFEQLVKEAFDTLFPRRQTYKTNVKHLRNLNDKVVLEWYVENNYYGGFRVIYQKEQALSVVDRVFHILDGGGVPGGYKSPLIDAINTSGPTGTGETTYFAFHAYHNMNLHLRFKDMRLVHELARIADVKDLVA